MLKVIIFILLIAMIASLTSGAVFFFKDQGNSKRTLYALGLRVTLAILLLAAVGWGLYSGQLTISAPWHPAPGGAESSNADQASIFSPAKLRGTSAAALAQNM
jgi:hypothetical protein